MRYDVLKQLTASSIRLMVSVVPSADPARRFALEVMLAVPAAISSMLALMPAVASRRRQIYSSTVRLPTLISREPSLTSAVTSFMDRSASKIWADPSFCSSIA